MTATLGLSAILLSLGLGELKLTGLAGQPAAHGWLVILAIPTAVAAAKLLQARKMGIFVSLPVLPLLGFALGMSVYSVLGASGTELVGKVLIDFSIASVLAMLGPLLLGWKSMPWKAPKRIRNRRRTAAQAG